MVPRAGLTGMIVREDLLVASHLRATVSRVTCGWLIIDETVTGVRLPCPWWSSMPMWREGQD